MYVYIYIYIYICINSRFRGGRIQSHELLEGARRLLDGSPLQRHLRTLCCEKAQGSINTQHSTLNTQHSALNTLHSTLNTQHSALNIRI